MISVPRQLVIYVVLIVTVCLISDFTYAGWEQQVSGTTLNLSAVTASHGDISFAWVCGDSGTILATSNGGETWTRQATGTTQNLHSIAFIEAETAPVIAVGDSGIILRTTAEDTLWRRLDSPTTQSLRDISDSGLLIVGDSGTILQSTDAGISWSLEASPTTERLNGVAGLFPAPLIAGDNGVILRTLLPADSLVICSTGTTANLYGIPMFSINNLVVGDSGLILRSSDFGAHWQRQSSPVTANLRATEFSVNNTSHIYVAGDSGTILKSTDEGVNWVQQTSSTFHDLNGLFFYLDDWNGFAAGDSGTILRTRDGGASTSAVKTLSPAIPQTLTLYQNFPNPFNPATEIRFDLPAPSVVRLTIFNLLGQEVVTLLDDVRPAGEYTLIWDGRNTEGLTVPSGMYICLLHAGSRSTSRKMVLMK